MIQQSVNTAPPRLREGMMTGRPGALFPLGLALTTLALAAGPDSDGGKPWAFQPVRRPDVPPAAAGGNPIDAFLARSLAAEGLTPAPGADRRTLVRRLTFDLIGLPPTPEEV